VDIPEGLSRQPRVVFKKNPLKTVVLQVRFPPILSLAQPVNLAPFQEAIRDEYPRAEAPSTQVSVAVADGRVMPPMAQTGPWRFASQDGAWVVSVTPDYVAIETSAYREYKDFAARASQLLDAARDVLRFRDQVRLGLRYVNEIRHPEAATVEDWAKLLDHDLLGIGGKILGRQIVQTVQVMQVQMPNGVLTIRHGWDAAGEGPSPYVIDLDAHDDETRPFDVGAVMSRAAEYRDWIGGFFRASLGQRLVDYLEPMEPEG
jgi:uncharacterized protein (TIGR04255 family)